MAKTRSRPSEPQLHGVLARSFRWHGELISRYPAWYIAVPLLLAAVCAVGLQHLTVDSDPNLIWVPPGSATALQKQFFDAAFDPFFRINQVIISLDDGAYTPAAAGRPYYDPQTDANRPVTGILTREYLLAVLALQQRLINASAADGTTLDAICYKPIVGEGCLIETPLDFFLSDAVAIAQLNASQIQEGVDSLKVAQVAARHAGTYIPGWSAIHTPMLANVVLGGVECLRGNVSGYAPSVCGGCGFYATSLVLTFLGQATDAAAGPAAAWENDVFLAQTSTWAYPGLRAAYMAQRSIQDEIAVVGAQNAGVVVISYVCMFVYITLALGKFPHPVFTRALLGLQGIAIVVLSCVASIGVCSWAGLHITMIVSEVVPFLILALGVDNVFILTKAFDRHWRGPYLGACGTATLDAAPGEVAGVAPASAGNSSSGGGDEDPAPATAAHKPLLGEEGVTEGAPVACASSSAPAPHVAPLPPFTHRMGIAEALGAALAEVGPTITAAAGCEALAFGVGAATDIPALRQFCVVAVVAVAIDYVLQLTWFAAAITLDAARQEGHRLDLAPCCVARRPRAAAAAMAAMAAAAASSAGADGSGVAAAATASSSSSSSSSSSQPRGGRSINDAAAPPAVSAAASAAGCCPCDCATRGRLWRVVGEGHYVRRFCSAYYAPALMWGPVRALVLLAWAAMLGVSLYGATQIGLGLEQQLAVSDGSYLTTYFDDQSRFGEAGPPLYVVLQNVNYTDPATVPAVESVVEQLTAVSRWIEPPVTSWVRQWAYWDSDVSRKFIATNVKTANFDCPTPLPPGNASVAMRIAQFLWNIPIVSRCCQNYNYCSAQYSSDVKFVWGVPKPAALAAAAAAGVTAPRSSEENVPSPAEARAAAAAAAGVAPPPTMDELRQRLKDQLTGQQPLEDAGGDEEDGHLAAVTATGQLLTDFAARLRRFQVQADAAEAAAAAAAGRDDSPALALYSGLRALEQRHAAAAWANEPASFPEATRAGLRPAGVRPLAGAARTRAQRPESEGAGWQAIDDGGCDLAYGYVSHREVAAAVKAQADAAAAGASASSASSSSSQQQAQLSLTLGPVTRLGAAAVHGGALSAATRAALARGLAANYYLPADASSSSGGPAPDAAAAAGLAGQRLLGALGGVSLVPCHVMTSRLRTQLTALHNQSDFVGALQHVNAAVATLAPLLPVADLSLYGVDSGALAPDGPGAASGTFVFNFTSDNEHTAWLAPAPGGAAFPYSLTFVYYDQYLTIRGVALWNTLLTVGVVYAAAYLVTSSLAVAGVTAALVLCVAVDMVGFLWALNPAGPDPYGEGPYGVDINAVSVVNLVAAVGLAVEFGVHIAVYFSHAKGTRQQRATAALVDMGSSVFTGITLTKLVGVSVLATAPSHLFRLYYFRMYLAIIIFGAFHGLCVLPVLLSLVGWAQDGAASTRLSAAAAADGAADDKADKAASAAVLLCAADGSPLGGSPFGGRDECGATPGGGTYAVLPPRHPAASAGGFRPTAPPS